MLDGKTISLRRPEVSDVEFLFKWENDSSNNGFSTINKGYSREEIINFIHDFTPVQISGQLRFMIVENDTNQPIGTIDLFDADFANQFAGVGILIADRQKRKNGIGFEALELLKVYSKNRLEFIHLSASIKSNNLASIHLFEKSGFKKVGVRKDWYFHKLKRMDEYIYQLCLNEI